MNQSPIRKTLSLGAIALIASALAMPAFAADTMGNPGAMKPANPCAQPAKHQEKKKAMNKHQAAKKHQKTAANPCAPKAANPCATKSNM